VSVEPSNIIGELRQRIARIEEAKAKGETVATGQDVCQGDDQFLAVVARDECYARAVAARTDPIAFFEFVIQEATTRAPIKVAPHQKVGIEFILGHRRSVNFWPVEFSKSFTVQALTLFILGQDPTARVAIVSATQEIASKAVAVIRDYIDTSVRLRMVFPHLRPSQRKGDPWTQTQITVDRPAGIADPSVVAHGMDSGAIQGSRLNWIIVDDLLNRENTATHEQREKHFGWLFNSVFNRIDKNKPARIAVMNFSWHNDDALHRLEKMGWASLRMDVYGDLFILDDAMDQREAEEEGLVFEPWNSDELRARSNDPMDNARVINGLTVSACRLKAHDPDPDNSTPLWPEKLSTHRIEMIRQFELLPHEFNRQLRNICTNDDERMCKQEYVNLSLRLGREFGVHSLGKHNMQPGMVAFTGVDLAVGLGEEHDMTAFFTFGVRADKRRVLLDLEMGRFQGPTIRDKIIAKHQQFDSICRVENIAAQEYLLQFVREKNVMIPIRPNTTEQRAKAHPVYGLPGLFLEMANGAWIFPCHPNGTVPKVVQEFCDACLNYVPERHVHDALMAAYFSREQAREWGLLSGIDLATLPPIPSLNAR
jgi:hypothetical protein